MRLGHLLCLRVGNRSLTGHDKRFSILSHPILPYFTLSYLTLSHLNLLYLILSSPTLSYLDSSDAIEDKISVGHPSSLSIECDVTKNSTRIVHKLKLIIIIIIITLFVNVRNPIVRTIDV